jgi:diacylglycerol kinase family enzyme
VPGFLIVNARSGDEEPSADRLVAAAQARGIEAHVLCDGEDPTELARAAGDASALGAAGGDGSLGAVAEVAVERGLPFVCVPFGTRNHFARDLGLDRDDPIGALEAFADGRDRVVDVGRVGPRLFLNNVSFGVYARLVHRREHHRGRRDAFATARAVLLTLRERHPDPIVVDGQPIAARVVLVANNAYELDVFNVGERTRLDEGTLYAYIAKDWLPRDWHERVADSLRIGAPEGRLRAAIDGEPVDLDSPVELRCEPAALRVRLPLERE